MSDVVFGLVWGLGGVVVIWLVWKFATRGPGGTPLSIKSLVTGKDKRLSLSKLQAVAWFFAIFFAYVAAYSVRVRHGDVAPLGDLPENIILILAFSAGGALGAKWITVYRDRAGTLKKTTASAPAARDLIADDAGYSAWNKLQLSYFTVLTLVIFFVGLVRELRLAGESPPMVPDVDTTLLALMGISQGAYLGKKTVE